MSQMNKVVRPAGSWLPWVVCLVAGALVGAWAYLTSQTQAEAPAAVSLAPPLSGAAGAQAGVQPDAGPGDVVALMSGQDTAAKALADQPDLPAVTGPVSTRPPYVSQMEWLMLQGVAQQHEAPERELTRMVNFLRFTKQVEWLQVQPRQGDAARRQALAQRLLAELPERISQGDMDQREATRLLDVLLQDLEPDAQARAARVQTEAQRLSQVRSPAPSAGVR